jgi:hypothetical protein
MVKLLTSAMLACLLTASTASADVQVLLNNGRVSIAAKDATVRQILTEWARIGQTKVVNVERIPGGPVTIELTDVPEGQALDMLLRSVSGYMAAPRGTVVGNLSVFDRIIVMPSVAAPRPAASSAQAAPVFQQPQFAPNAPPPNDDPDDPPGPNVQLPNQPRGPVFNAFPPPQAGAPQPPNVVPGMVPVNGPGQTGVTQPAAYPGSPTAPATGGVAVPGMIVPGPLPVVSPSVPYPPTQPGQVTRPGGRGGPGRE